MAGDLVQCEIAFISGLWCNWSPVESPQSSQYPPLFSGRIQLNLICSILAQANLWLTSDSNYPHLHLYFLPPMQAATIMKKRGGNPHPWKNPQSQDGQNYWSAGGEFHRLCFMLRLPETVLPFLAAWLGRLCSGISRSQESGLLVSK